MEKLKIIFLEEGEILDSDKEKFASDAKEIAEWIKKVLDDSPSVKIFSFKSNEEPQLLKVVKKEVPNVCIELINDKEISEARSKNTENIICAVLCVDGKIFGTPITMGALIPLEYFSSYAQARMLAEHINEI